MARRRPRPERNPELDLSIYSVKADKWDHRVASSVHEEDKEFAQEGRLLEQHGVETGKELWNDTFFEFYNAEPTLLEDKEIAPSHRVDRAIMEHMTEVPAYEELREYCMGDPFASADACVSVRPTLEAIWDRMKIARETAKQLQEMYEEMARMMAEQGEGDSNPGDGSEGGEMNAEMQELQDAIDAAEQKMGQEMREQAGIVRHEFSESLEDAKNEAEAMDMVRGLMPGQKAGKGGGRLTPMSYQQRKALAKLLNEQKVKDAFALIGAMTKSLKNMNRERLCEGVEEIIDIDLGHELMQVVLSEFVMLKDPRARFKFMKDYHGDNLQVYETIGHEPVENGDIIVCIDGSGSMRGEKDVWAKAVGMVLLHIARTQRRGFRGILFDTRTWEYDFSSESNYTPERVASFIRDFPGGGTDFVAPLDIARGWIKDDIAKTGRTSADIVLITDGLDSVTPDWLEKWKSDQEIMDFKTWGVMIGDPAAYSRFYNTDTLTDICDGRVMNATDMRSGKDLDMLWKNI